MGNPELYGVMLGTFFALWTENLWAVNSVNDDWRRWTEMLPSLCWSQVNAVPKNSRHLPWNWLGCVLGVMSWIGPPGLDLMNKIRNLQHRGRRGVGIELLRWSQERMGWQVHQKIGRGSVVRPWGSYWAESLGLYCTNDGGIDVGHKAFSWGASIHLLGQPGCQLEVLLQ